MGTSPGALASWPSSPHFYDQTNNLSRSRFSHPFLPSIPFTTFWHFWILASSFPFWSSINLSALYLCVQTNSASRGNRVTTFFLTFFLQRSTYIWWSLFKITFTLFNIEFVATNHTWEHYFCKLFWYVLFLSCFFNILFRRLTSAFTLKIPKLSTLLIHFLIKYKIY